MSETQNKATGIILKIDAPQVISEKLTKRQIVLTVGDKYPEPIAFEAVNDKCDLLGGLTEGSEATVYYNLRGREWNGRYFVNLSLWKIEAAGTAQSAPAKANINAANANPSLRQQPQAAQIADESDGLPF